MPHWKTILTYDGTPYNGWQIQPDQPTVQGSLAEAILHVTGEHVLPQGSGRTDTGVHALAQVATFTLTVPIPPENLHRALNRALPPSIRILSVESVPPGFHARHNALRKTYEYRIFPTGKTGAIICPPMLAPYVWACHLDLDLPTLQQAATHVLGTHDFTSFAASDPDLTTRNASTPRFDADFFSQLDTDILTETESDRSEADRSEAQRSQPQQSEAAASTHPAKPDHPTPRHTGNIRTIFDSTWRQQDDLLIYLVTGSGFLHHMVRNLVGTFVEASARRISPDDLPAILQARNRSAAGPTAPARGLFLVEVLY